MATVIQCDVRLAVKDREIFVVASRKRMVRESEWSIVDVAMEVDMALGGTTEQ